MKKRRNNWMLLKIVLIAIIIAVMLALLVPQISVNPRHPSKTECRIMLSTIVMALKSYESTYGFLPFGEEKTERDTIVDDKYDILMELLSGVDGPDKGNRVTKNARGIRFLEVPSDFGENGFVDSWDQKFRIYIDTNYDAKQMVGDKELHGSVFVYSYGENGKDDKGKEDDICSWE